MKQGIGLRLISLAVMFVLMNALVESGFAAGRAFGSQRTNPASVNSAWALTGSLNGAREGHTARLLPNGEVIVLGGYAWVGTPLNGGTFWAPAPQPIVTEIYSPVTGTWRVAANPGIVRLFYSNSVLLPNGEVLFAGGVSGGSLAEAYHPLTGTWRTTALFTGQGPGLTLLLNGKVLILESTGGTAQARLYDPYTDTSALTGAPIPNSGTGLTPLFNGNVLSIGCYANSQLYDFVTERWVPIAPPHSIQCPTSVTQLTDGRVLVTAGGVAELYSPDTDSWSPTSPQPIPTLFCSATLMPNGQVLLVGGSDMEDVSVRAAQLYDPPTGQWSAAPMPITSRGGHSATLLTDGKLLIVGGFEGACCDVHLTLSSAELFGPAPTGSPEPSISIGDTSVTEGHEGTRSATFTVTVSNFSGQTISIAYTTASGSAAAGSDYQASSGVVTFDAGQTTRTVTVPVNGDRLGEPDETFAVDIRLESGSAVIADGQGIATIIDDEPRVSIDDVSQDEGNLRSSSFVFTVRLSLASDAAVSLDFATSDGAATAREDYEAQSGSLTFNPGETTKTISIAVRGDFRRENDEVFYLNLMNASGAFIIDAQGVGTIRNDDR